MSAEATNLTGWVNGYAVFEILAADGSGKVIGYELIGPDGYVETFMLPGHTQGEALSRFRELSEAPAPGMGM